MQGEYLYAEMFTQIEPRFSQLANEHLRRFLIQFDKAYVDHGGKSDTLAHAFDRHVAAGSLCREVARILEESGDCLTWLKTESEFFSSSLTSPIFILTRSFFKVDHTSDLTGPLLYPN